MSSHQEKTDDGPTDSPQEPKHSPAQKPVSDLTKSPHGILKRKTEPGTGFPGHVVKMLKISPPHPTSHESPDVVKHHRSKSGVSTTSNPLTPVRKTKKRKKRRQKSTGKSVRILSVISQRNSSNGEIFSEGGNIQVVIEEIDQQNNNNDDVPEVLKPVDSKWNNQFKFFENDFEMDSDFENEEEDFLKMFGCKILFAFSVQLAILLAFKISQVTYNVFATDYHSALIHLSIYTFLYIFARGFRCAHKYPENLLLLAIITYFAVASFGNFDYGSFTYIFLIYLATIILSLLGVIVHINLAEVDIESFCLYIVAFGYYIVSTLSVLLVACLYLEVTNHELDFELLIVYYPAGLVYTIVIMFELQRILRGRRISLSKDEWPTATMILPFSLIFPAYLIRKLADWSGIWKWEPSWIAKAKNNKVSSFNDDNIVVTYLGSSNTNDGESNENDNNHVKVIIKEPEK